MRIEVLCTGDELLTGLTVDTNSPYFEARVFDLGEKVARAQIVGDVREDIVAALRGLSEHADAALVSGGLGPTADDITAECAAAAAGVALVEDAEVLRALEERFARRGVAFTANNARQARIPAGAEVVKNPVGTAPMFVQKMGRCTLFFVPGVPREYRALVDREVLPRLQRLIERQAVRVFRAPRLLKTVGLPESHLDAKVAPLAAAHPKVSFGFRTHLPENHLKLVGEGASQREAEEALAAAERACQEALEPYVFGADGDEFPAVVGTLLRQRRHTAAVAESCTGGLVAELLTSPAGASAYFLAGAVTYSERMKARWAGVSEAALAQFGAVSEEVAVAMAQGARSACEATYGLSVTGYAGPEGGTERDPVGTVYCALAGPEGTECQRRRFGGDRERIRQLAAYHVLEMLRRRVLGVGSP